MTPPYSCWDKISTLSAFFVKPSLTWGCTPHMQRRLMMMMTGHFSAHHSYRAPQSCKIEFWSHWSICEIWERKLVNFGFPWLQITHPLFSRTIDKWSILHLIYRPILFFLQLKTNVFMLIAIGMTLWDKTVEIHGHLPRNEYRHHDN